MLLHAAGNMSMRSDGFNVADAVDIIVKARSSEARWPVRRRRMACRVMRVRGELVYHVSNELQEWR